MAEVEIQTERVDDIPLLIRQQEQMGIPDVLNEVIRPHGNRKGLSVGWLVAAWLSSMLSEADHRMSEVEPWAEQHMQTLQALLPEPVQVKDFTDDRLADVLRALSDDETWAEIETRFSRLKGHPLGIRPLYVQREDHARGMVHLLSLALRVLTVVEHVVRKGLQAAGETLKGLYAGNPNRETARPTTERLLKAFRGITLSIVRLPEQTICHVTPLSALQRRILELLGLSASIYQDLALLVEPILPSYSQNERTMGM